MPNLNLQAFKDAIGSLLGLPKEDHDAIQMLTKDHRRVDELVLQFSQSEDNTEKKQIATKIMLELTVHAKLEEELVYPLLTEIELGKNEAAKKRAEHSRSQVAHNGDDQLGRAHAKGDDDDDDDTNSENEIHSSETEHDGGDHEIRHRYRDEDADHVKEEDTDDVDEAYVEHHLVKFLISEIEDMNPGDKFYVAKVTVLGELVKHHVKEEEAELFPKLRHSGEDMNALGEKLQQRKAQILEQLKKKPRMSESRGAGTKTTTTAKVAKSTITTKGAAKSKSTKAKSTTAKSTKAKSTKGSTAKSTKSAKATKATGATKGRRSPSTKATSAKSKTASAKVKTTTAKSKTTSRTSGRTTAAGRKSASGSTTKRTTAAGRKSTAVRIATASKGKSKAAKKPAARKSRSR